MISKRLGGGGEGEGEEGDYGCEVFANSFSWGNNSQWVSHDTVKFSWIEI